MSEQDMMDWSEWSEMNHPDPNDAELEAMYQDWLARQDAEMMADVDAIHYGMAA